MDREDKNSLLQVGILGTSIVSAMVTTRMPWGPENGFHGTGFPLASVYWDHGRDYPNPFAMAENVAVYWIAGLLIYFVVKGVVVLVRRLRSKPRV